MSVKRLPGASQRGLMSVKRFSGASLCVYASLCTLVVTWRIQPPCFPVYSGGNEAHTSLPVCIRLVTRRVLPVSLCV